MNKQSGQMVSTTIRLPKETWKRLRRLAEARALKEGGRPSISAYVASLVSQVAA